MSRNKAVKKSKSRNKRSAEEASVNGDLSSVCKITKEVITAHAPIELPVLDKNSDLLSSKDEQLRRWKQHFSAVLNRLVFYDASPYAQDLAQIRNLLCN